MKKLLVAVLLGLLAFVTVCFVARTSEQTRIGNIKDSMWALLERLGPNVSDTDEIKKQTAAIVARHLPEGRVRNIKISSRSISFRQAEKSADDAYVLDRHVSLSDSGNARYYETTLTMDVTSTMVPLFTNKYRIRRVLISYVGRN